jgi:hypothetical protein
MRYPVRIDAHIPPPTISHRAERIKKTFALYGELRRFISPITKNIIGGANVIEKQM